MDDQRLENIKKEVRSVLISSKEGMTLQEFLKEYRCLLGIRLPTRELGFTTDIELIESMPDIVCMKTDRNGSFVLTAIADETTKHIQKLVQKQKNNNKKKLKNNQKHVMYNSVFNHKYSLSSLQKNRPFVPANLKSEILQILERHPNGIGYAALITDYNKTFSKNINLEWLAIDPSERFRKLVLAVPEFELKTVGNIEKLFLSKNLKDTKRYISNNLDAVQKALPPHSDPSLSFCNKNKGKAVISKSLKDNFEKVLKHFSGGILAVHFPALYQKLIGHPFDLHEIGYNSLLEMADDLSDIFLRVRSTKSSNDWILLHKDNKEYAPNMDHESSVVYRSNSNYSRNKISYNLKENLPSDIALPTLSYITPELPKEGQTLYVPVYISAIISPSLFWFQLQAQDSILHLKSLEKEMERFYNNPTSSRYKIANADIMVGAICAAFYSVDNLWYRVVISSIPSTDSVVVDFVDYGSSDHVSKSALYYLKYNFTHLPAQAFKAQLADIKPANNKNTWAKKSSERFIDLCNRIILMAQIKAINNSTVSVFLCDTSGDDDVHINNVLVEEGYAEFHRTKDNSNTPLPLYLNESTSEMSSTSTSPSPSPSPDRILVNQYSENGTRDSCCKKLFTDQLAHKQQMKKCVKRLLSSDDYSIHILLVENLAYVSLGDLSNLFWSDKSPDLLLIRLKYKKVTMPTITIWKDDFPDLFEQCKRFFVKGFCETENSVILFPLEYALNILNILGHPSANVRQMIIKEMNNFHPGNVEWKELFEEPEPCKEYVDCENELDRLCLHDLEARYEAYRYLRAKLLVSLQRERSDELISQLKILDAAQNYITNRIQKVNAICTEFSKPVSFQL